MILNTNLMIFVLGAVERAHRIAFLNLLIISLGTSCHSGRLKEENVSMN